MPFLPEPIDSDMPIGSIRSARSLRRAQVEVYEHSVQAAKGLAMEETDAFASGEATRFSLEEEIDLYEYGKRRAGSDPVIQALAMNKLSDFVNRNDRRLKRRYS
jgi:hypothetical protein